MNSLSGVDSRFTSSYLSSFCFAAFLELVFLLLLCLALQAAVDTAGNEKFGCTFFAIITSSSSVLNILRACAVSDWLSQCRWEGLIDRYPYEMRVCACVCVGRLYNGTKTSSPHISTAIMDLKVAFVIICLCALAITSTEGNHQDSFSC